MDEVAKIGDVSSFCSRTSVYDYDMVKLELSASCNARCVFCTMFSNSRKPHGFLSLHDAERFVDINADWLNECGLALEPFFNGESLLNPHVYDILDVIASRAIRIGDLDTNLGVATDITRLASYGWRSITVNIGGLSAATHWSVMGTDFNLVVSNLKRLLLECDGRFCVYVKMNPTKDNIHDIRELPRFCSELGGGLRWKDQQTGLPVPSDCSDDEIRSFLEAVYSTEGERYFRFVPTGTSVNAKNPRCIYQVPCVCCNGDVTVCSHDQLRHLSCGNAFVAPLKGILDSPEYRRCVALGRNRGLPFCRGCN